MKNAVVRRYIRLKKMLIAALLLNIKEQRGICISLARLNNAVFGKEIAVGLKLT